MYQKERLEQQERVIETLEQQQHALTDFIVGLRTELGGHGVKLRTMKSERLGELADKLEHTQREGERSVLQFKIWISEMARGQSSLPSVTALGLLEAWGKFAEDFEAAIDELVEQLRGHALVKAHQGYSAYAYCCGQIADGIAATKEPRTTAIDEAGKVFAAIAQLELAPCDGPAPSVLAGAP